MANPQPLGLVPASASAIALRLANNVGEFAEIVMSRDASAAVAYFEARRAEGASIESLFEVLLAPTARRLGELWDEDINDFLDVTRGFSHLPPDRSWIQRRLQK